MLAVRRLPAAALVNVPDGGDGDGNSLIDALLPPAMARRAEEIGVRKVAMAPMRMLALAVLAGAFIGLGGAFRNDCGSRRRGDAMGTRARGRGRGLQPRADPRPGRWR